MTRRRGALPHRHWRCVPGAGIEWRWCATGSSVVLPANQLPPLGGTVIPQAHPTGYPLYRLEWQGLGSLQRRLRNCLSGIRAQPWPYGAQELVELELYLAAQASGMVLESPAVRP